MSEGLDMHWTVLLSSEIDTLRGGDIIRVLALNQKLPSLSIQA